MNALPREQLQSVFGHLDVLFFAADRQNLLHLLVAVSDLQLAKAAARAEQTSEGGSVRFVRHSVAPVKSRSFTMPSQLQPRQQLGKAQFAHSSVDTVPLPFRYITVTLCVQLHYLAVILPHYRWYNNN